MKQSEFRSKKSKNTVKRENGKALPVAELDMKELMFNTHNRTGGEMYFLTKMYKGHLLGFYSHSPWGGTRDKEQGWALIKYETLEVVEELATRTDGVHTGEFREWYKMIGEVYGKAKYLVDSNGDRKWKITEVDK